MRLGIRVSLLGPDQLSPRARPGIPGGPFRFPAGMKPRGRALVRGAWRPAALAAACRAGASGRGAPRGRGRRRAPGPAGRRPGHDRHAARRRDRVRRATPAARLPTSTASRAEGRVFDEGARPQRHHAAVAHEHPDGPASLPARRARKRGIPALAEDRRRRLRGSRRRATPRAPSSAPTCSTRATGSATGSTSTRSCTGTSTSSSSSTSSRPRAEDVVAAAHGLVPVAGRQAPVPLGPRLRSACPLRPARRPSSSDSKTTGISARSPTRTRRSAPLLEAVRATDPPPLLVVTGDHGEARGDHGELTHGLFCYEATLHVPLFAWCPPLLPASRDDDARAPHRHPADDPRHRRSKRRRPDLPGQSLLPARRKEAEGGTYFEALSAAFNRGLGAIARFDVRRARSTSSFPCPSSTICRRTRGRSRTWSPPDPTRSAVCASVCWSFPPPSAERGTIGSEEAAKLKSLGYLTGPRRMKTTYGPGRRSQEPDRRGPEDPSFHRRVRDEAYDEALKIAREVVDENPKMRLGYMHLVTILQARGDLAAALAACERPPTTGRAARAWIGAARLLLSEMGRPVGSRGGAAPVPRERDPETLNALGIALADVGPGGGGAPGFRAGDRDRSVQLAGLPEHGHRAPEARPPDEARKNLEQAIRPRQASHPRVERPRRGVDAPGEPRKAIAAWQTCLEINPEQYDALYNIGRVAGQLGDWKTARAALERFVEGGAAEAVRPGPRRGPRRPRGHVPPRALTRVESAFPYGEGPSIGVRSGLCPSAAGRGICGVVPTLPRSLAHAILAASNALRGFHAPGGDPGSFLSGPRVGRDGRAGIARRTFASTGDRIREVGELLPEPGERSSRASGWCSLPASSTSTTTPKKDSVTDPAAQTQVSQGITTLVLGPDGGSPWPIGDIPRGAPQRAPPAVNVMTMVGHETVRSLVMGEDYKPQGDARGDREDGRARRPGHARGRDPASPPGLEYDVGSYASTEELVDSRARRRRARRFLHDAHARRSREDLRGLRGGDQIARNGGPAARDLAHQARDRGRVGSDRSARSSLFDPRAQAGLDVTADCYPYEAWHSNMEVSFRTSSTPTRRASRRRSAVVGGPARITDHVLQGAPEPMPGTDLEEIAPQRRHDPGGPVLEDGRRGGGADIIGHSMKEEDVVKLLPAPWVMVGSDGGHRQRPPPRRRDLPARARPVRPREAALPAARKRSAR